jgi:hypothetical protein
MAFNGVTADLQSSWTPTHHYRPRMALPSMVASLRGRLHFFGGIEFFPDGSQDTPCILIHYGSLNDYRLLMESCLSLARSTLASFALHRRPGFSGVPVVATAAERDVGVSRCGSADSFLWELTPDSWASVAGLLEPFAAKTDDAHAHQYVEHAGDIRVIVSTDRSW